MTDDEVLDRECHKCGSKLVRTQPEDVVACPGCLEVR